MQAQRKLSIDRAQNDARRLDGKGREQMNEEDSGQRQMLVASLQITPEKGV